MFFAVESFDGFSVKKIDDIRHILSDQIDQISIEGLCFRVGGAFPDSILGHFCVSFSFFSNGFNVRDGIVCDFICHGLIHLLTGNGYAHGMSRSCVCPWSHDKKVACDGNKKAR